MEATANTKTTPVNHVPTIAAIGVLVYVLASITHEGLGHGGSSFLVGVRSIKVASTYEAADQGIEFLRPLDNRIILAGGTLLNLAAGLIYLGALKSSRKRSAQAGYFLWLSASINLLQAGGYLMVSPFGGFGDWHAFVAGLDYAPAWKLALTAMGVAVSIFGLRVCFRYLQPFVPIQMPEKARQSVVLSLTPYLAGCSVITISAFRSGGGSFLILFSAAAATFFGTCWLLWAPWAPQVLRGASVVSSNAETAAVGPSTVLIVLGIAATILCIWFLGPGVHIRL